MSTIGAFVVPNIRAIRWDGTNGAQLAQLLVDIVSEGADWRVDSEIPGDRLAIGGYSQPGPSGIKLAEQSVHAAVPWLVVDVSGDIHLVTDADMALAWKTSIPPAALPAPPAVQTLTMAFGKEPLPAITLVSPNVSVVVPLDVAMPDTNYALSWDASTAVAVLSGPGNPIQLQAIANPIVKTTTSITFHVRAVGLATVAGMISARAWTLR